MPEKGMPTYGSHTEKEGKVMTGAQALIASLEAEGVDTIFGYPGGQAIKIYDALYDSKILKHVLTRHEQGATHAADGYARATGKPGVVIVTSGPGATNTVTGIATAYADSVPMVIITGQVPRRAIGTDAFQEVDIVGITMPIVKHSYLLQDPAELTKTVREAFYIASTGRPGPVLIDIPSDIFTAEFEFHYPDSTEMASYKPTVKGNAKQVRQAVSLLKKAKKPLLYVGGGCIAADATDELLDFVDLLQIPVVTTLMAKGAIPCSNKLNLGPVGMHGSMYANYTMTDCDLLIAVGARFSDRVTGRIDSFAPNAQVIHIDVDPAEISKNRTADVPIVGDAKGIMANLVAEAKKQGLKPAYDEWLQQIFKWREAHPFYNPGIASEFNPGCGSCSVPCDKDRDSWISPEGSLELLSDMLDPLKSIVVTDVGQHQMWAAQHIHRELPRTFLSSGGAGTMGFGLPGAMGAAAAFPDKTVVCISGDGSFQMCAQEMATCAINNFNVKVLLMDNRTLGMVHQWQNLFYENRFSSTVLDENPDFVKLSEAFYWQAEQVKHPSELKGALERLLSAEGPALLDMRICPGENVYPMVAPGAAIDDIIGAVSVGDIFEMLTGEERD